MTLPDTDEDVVDMEDAMIDDGVEISFSLFSTSLELSAGFFFTATL